VWGVVGGVSGFIGGGFIGQAIGGGKMKPVLIGCFTGAALGALLLAIIGP
jgi:hypothetical protein